MADAAFTGFTKETIRFFTGLRRNNDRDWFAAHREIYDQHVMEPAKAFVVAMGERLRTVAPRIVAVPLVNKSIFRINRDTRFSLDPSPYKTNLGLYFWEGTKGRMECPGFYFHLEPPDLFLGGGMYMFPDSLVPRYRRAVIDAKLGPELRKIVSGTRRAEGIRARRDALQARPGRLRPRPPERRASQAQRPLCRVRVEDPRGALFGPPRRLLLRALQADPSPAPLARETGRVTEDRMTTRQDFYFDILNNLFDGLYFVDRERRITFHRVTGPAGERRLIVFSGLFPARLASSEDDGRTWTPLEPVGDWGGIVVMSSVVPLRTGRGHYLAMFHDDGRFFRAGGHADKPALFTVLKTFSRDGGRSWSFPEAVYASRDIQLCEPGVVRSPDGTELAALFRENSRTRNSFVMFSTDEGRTWSAPRELPGALTGDRHTAKYAPDGRLLVSFRDTTLESPTHGDWVAWVGRYEDIARSREGQYRVLLARNTKGEDCAYPGVEVLPDGTFVLTTYGHWTEGEAPYIISVRLKLDELDRLAAVRSP